MAKCLPDFWLVQLDGMVLLFTETGNMGDNQV